MEIFSKDIVLEEEILDHAADTLEGGHAGAHAHTPDLVEEKIRLMIALSWMDRHLDSRELDFVSRLLENPELSEPVRQELEASLDSGKVSAVNYDAFDGRDDEKIATLMDMIALMKVDDEVHPAERLFVKKVGEEFGLPEADVVEMMAL